MVVDAPWPEFDPGAGGRRRGGPADPDQRQAPRRDPRRRAAPDRPRSRRSSWPTRTSRRHLEGLTVRKIDRGQGPHRQYRGGLSRCGAAVACRVLALLAAGSRPRCGFTPLYGRRRRGRAAWPRIDVERAQDGRTGYLLREQLDDALGRDRAAARRLPAGPARSTSSRCPRGLRDRRHRHPLRADAARPPTTLTAVAGGQTVAAGRRAGRPSPTTPPTSPTPPSPPSRTARSAPPPRPPRRIRLDLRWPGSPSQRPRR